MNYSITIGSATAFLPGNLRNTYYKVLEEAKNKKATITFDPNYREVLITDDIMKQYKDDCWNFMRKAEFIKISDEEAKLLTETDNIELAVKSLINSKLNAIAITLGKDVYVVPYPLKTVNDSGCNLLLSQGAFLLYDWRQLNYL